MSTEERIAAVRSRLAAAAEGPWEVHDDWYIRRPGRFSLAEVKSGDSGIDRDGHKANALLIANAPADLQFLLARCEHYELALAQIAKGEGPFSRDPLTFAENVIETQKGIARSALAAESPAEAQLENSNAASPMTGNG